jgi:hypothetical protein
MTVGFPAEQGQINNKAGSLAMALRDTFRDIKDFNDFLNGKDEAALVALGFTTDEVTLLKASFVDLNKLGLIAIGQEVQPAPNDFFFNAKNLLGVE